MSSGRRGRGEEDEEYSEGEGNGSDSQEPSEIDNRGVDGGDGDGGGGDGGDGGDRGAEDSPKTLSEVHAMLTTLLRHFNVPLPTTRNEGDAKPKRHRVRRVKSKMITLAATPAARGLQPVIQYILTELPHIIQEILR